MSSAPLDLSPFLDEYQMDTGGGDRTSQITVPADARLIAAIVPRQPVVTAALELIERLPEKLRLEVSGTQQTEDGVRIDTDKRLGTLEGNARQILGLERTLLNGLQLLCGIATTTAQWVDALPENVILLDTRKTHPTLRSWERLAIRCGGGINHRFNLADTIMIKDNHIAAGGGLEICVQRAVEQAGHSSKIICEVESLDDAQLAVKAGAHGLLIDNKPVSEWSAYWETLPGNISLEFSGGISFDMIPDMPKPPRRIHVSTSRTIIGANPIDIGLDVERIID